jgi:hypothetical protein
MMIFYANFFSSLGALRHKPPMDTKKATAVAPSMVASGGAVPTTYSTAAGINGGSGSHAVRQPPAMSASAPVPTTKVAKEKATTKDTPKKKKKKKKSKKKNASEKVPLMGKVKQAKMAHKMTKGNAPAFSRTQP